jgi:hypothetical protein
MRCPCGASAKCLRRHWSDPERDEFKCESCSKTFHRYQIPKRGKGAGARRQQDPGVTDAGQMAFDFGD